MPEPVLSARAVKVQFGGLVAVDDVDLDLHPGELVGVIGPNGAGKTTFFHTLSGVLVPNAGRLVVGGDELTGRPPHEFAMHGVARTFQTPRVFRDMSAEENVRFGLEFAGRARKHAHDAFDDARSILGFLGLEDAAAQPRFLPPGWTGGLNVVLRRSLGIDSAIALSTVTKETDRAAVVRRASRELFFVPWCGVTMVGTDYIPFRDWSDWGEGGDCPPLAAIESFVEEIGRVAPKSRLTMDDVAMTHWGVLPTEAAGSMMPHSGSIVSPAGPRPRVHSPSDSPGSLIHR